MPKISFHSFPDVTTSTGKTWIRKIRRDPVPDFVINKNTKVCSLHFTSDDYISGDAALHSARRVLKATAVPSVFPWTREVCQQKSKTSQLAASMDQRSDLVENDVTQADVKDVSYSPEENYVEFEGKFDILEMQRKIDELQVKLAQVESTDKGFKY